jgi:hypothetical protein
MVKAMSIYRNEAYNFEIDLPEGWAITSGLSRLPVILSNAFKHANILEEFSNGSKEFINIVVEAMRPEIPPDICELIFTINALKMRYTEVEFGRITIGGREHACAFYVMNQKAWLKKYLIVLNGYGYALTASCPIEQRSTIVEETWDRIATSLRLLNPSDPSVIALNNSSQGRRTIALLRKALQVELLRRRSG